MKRFYLPIFALFFLFLVNLPVSAQISLSNQAKAIFSGQVVDARSGQPIVEALVTVRTQYQDYKTKTDNAGNFVFEVDDKEGLKNFLFLVSHSDYREKDFAGVLRNSFTDGKAKISLQGSGNTSQAMVKFKKSELGLTCGRDDRFATKDGRLISARLDCLSNERVLLLELNRGDHFTLRTNADVEMEVKENNTKIECSKTENLEINIKALMFKR